MPEFGGFFCGRRNRGPARHLLCLAPRRHCLCSGERALWASTLLVTALWWPVRWAGALVVVLVSPRSSATPPTPLAPSCRRRLTLVAGGRHLVPKNSRRKSCPVLCWANNDGACGRRFPCWRRCCVVLGDVILPPHRRVAIDVLHLLSLLWSPPFGVVAVAIRGSIPSALLMEGRCRMGCGSGVGLRRKPLPACRLMMATPSGPVSLLGGIIRLPLPPSCPMAGHLAGGSFFVPASLHFTHCRLDCFGCGE